MLFYAPVLASGRLSDQGPPPPPPRYFYRGRYFSLFCFGPSYPLLDCFFDLLSLLIPAHSPSFFASFRRPCGLFFPLRLIFLRRGNPPDLFSLTHPLCGLTSHPVQRQVLASPFLCLPSPHLEDGGLMSFIPPVNPLRSGFPLLAKIYVRICFMKVTP